MGDTQIQIKSDNNDDESNSHPPIIKVSGRGPEKYFTKSIKKLTHALFSKISIIIFFSVLSKQQTKPSRSCQQNYSTLPSRRN